MAVKLGAEQQRTVRAVVKSADRNHASPMERLAAIEAIAVEANYGNPDYGDRDSLGAFQQRASWGPASSRLNPGESADRFFQRAKTLRQGKQFKNASELAQAVQVSAYPGRYGKRRGEAKAVLAQYGGGGLAGGTSLAVDVNGGQTGAPGAGAFDPTRGTVSALEITRPVAPAGSAPVAPAAAALARPVMPQAYPGAPESGAPVPQVPDVQSQLADNSASFGTPQAQQQAQQGQQGGGLAAGAAPHVKIAAGANIAGRPLDPSLLAALDHLSAASGRPLTVTTGTNHSKLTVDGNVSEHYVGRGADLAMRGRQLTDTGTDALLVFGRGKTVQWLRNDGRVVNVRLTAANTRKLAEAGGIFNVPAAHGGRVQVILNTYQGGDHTNHLHIGVRPGR